MGSPEWKQAYREHQESVFIFPFLPPHFSVRTMGIHRLWENSDCEQTAAEQTALSLVSSMRQRVSTRAQLHPDNGCPCLDALPSHTAIKGAIAFTCVLHWSRTIYYLVYVIFCFPSNNGPCQERVKNNHTYTTSLEPCQLKGWASASSSTGDH